MREIDRSGAADVTTFSTKAVYVVLWVVLAVSAVAAHPRAHQLNGYTFERYVKDFGKHYSTGTAEFYHRKSIFESTLADVMAHNSRGHSWSMGINHMSDWTAEELKRINGARPRAMGHLADKRLQIPFKPQPRAHPLPASVDYRTRVPAVLTATKDQGMCGSCWAHGATEQMETYWALATNELYDLSQQEIVSCAPDWLECGGIGGCFGSTAELAYEYAVWAGLTQEWSYPYTSYNGSTGTCLQGSDRRIALLGYTKLPPNDQAAVMDVLAEVGPLAVNVDAAGMTSYESGILGACNYSNNITIDHVVQLVGYGHDDELNLDYWIIRNSWSPDFGENGYIRLLRTSVPDCGWDVDPQSGYGCSGGPNQLWVCGMCGILGDSSYPVVTHSKA